MVSLTPNFANFSKANLKTNIISQSSITLALIWSICRLHFLGQCLLWYDVCKNPCCYYSHEIPKYFLLVYIVINTIINSYYRFGLIAAAKAIREVKAGSEFICHYNFKFHEGQPWYQEMWRTKVDQDTPEGPFGHREHKKIPGQPISPMLTDSQFYKEFYDHALNVLNLEPLT